RYSVTERGGRNGLGIVLPGCVRKKVLPAKDSMKVKVSAIDIRGQLVIRITRGRPSLAVLLEARQRIMELGYASSG
ncbi:MAG: hypothetical protein M0P30_11770, partial [Syntrophorhabdaceae bacterium]|nr:hypothetical protein [Syntrophorhabdaceae bacterium]